MVWLLGLQNTATGLLMPVAPALFDTSVPVWYPKSVSAVVVMMFRLTSVTLCGALNGTQGFVPSFFTNLRADSPAVVPRWGSL